MKSNTCGGDHNVYDGGMVCTFWFSPMTFQVSLVVYACVLYINEFTHTIYHIVWVNSFIIHMHIIYNIYATPVEESNIYDGGVVCTFHSVMFILQSHRYNSSSLCSRLKIILYLVFQIIRVPHSIPHWGTPAFHPTQVVRWWVCRSDERSWKEKWYEAR